MQRNKIHSLFPPRMFQLALSKLMESASAERFLQTLSKSGLIDRADLKRLLEEAPTSIRGDARALSEHLVEKQRLTHFQAAKLLEGTWQGLVLGPFQVLAPLGRGGMGSVYLARNAEARPDATAKPASLPSLVALKVLPPKRAKQEDRTLARFLREMDLCQRVSHPHVTKTFDAGILEGVYYIAMEYIRGASLRQFVKNSGPLPTARAARYFSEIAVGLAHAHEKGLIHRDLKPSNLMVTPNGHGKILDLGLALAVDEELPQDKMIVGGQGYVVGTMDYIAPEQVDNAAQVDARADLYALGCTMYFALTGQPPFKGGSSQEKMNRHRTVYAEPVPDLNPTVPIAFARIVEKLMEKNPARRYCNADEVRQALLPWIADDPEKPLDTDPRMTEAEAIQFLEQEQSSEPGLWWESVPVISFEATAKYSSRANAGSGTHKRIREAPATTAQSDAPTGETPERHPLLVVGLIVGLLIGFVALLQWLRRL